MWRFFAIAMLSVLMAGFAQAGAVTSTDLDAPDASASERDVEYAPGEDREPAPAPAAEPAKEAPVKTKKDEAPPQAPRRQTGTQARSRAEGGARA